MSADNPEGIAGPFSLTYTGDPNVIAVAGRYRRFVKRFKRADWAEADALLRRLQAALPPIEPKPVRLTAAEHYVLSRARVGLTLTTEPSREALDDDAQPRRPHQ